MRQAVQVEGPNGRKERRGRPSRGALAVLLATGLLGMALSTPDAQAKPAKHRPKKPRTIQEDDWASAPSAKYAGLTRSECVGELKRRKVKFKELESARGVVMPIRLKGALNGVLYRTELPAAERPDTPYEVMDCRLALALHDFSEVLVAHDIEEAIMFSAWRPPAKSWPADKPAIRHPGGLAIDLRRFVKKAPASGGKASDLVIERDWTPARDAQPCTDDARAKGSAEQKELVAIFCAADEARTFTSQLSPNYDKAHDNHFHLEIRPDVRWRLVL